MITVKKIVLKLVLEIQKPTQEIDLATLQDALQIAEKVFANL